MLFTLLAAIPSIFRTTFKPKSMTLKDFFRIHRLLSYGKSNVTTVLNWYRENPATLTALQARPRLENIDLRYLASLPWGTLGREYVEFIRRTNIDPSVFPTLTHTTEHEYVCAHLFETHDLWHLILNFDIDYEGEIKLQGFYAGQSKSRLNYLLLIFGLIQCLFSNQKGIHQRMDGIMTGYLLGRKAKPFFGVDWKQHWHRPLVEIRQELGLYENISVELHRSVFSGTGKQVS